MDYKLLMTYQEIRDLTGDELGDLHSKIWEDINKVRKAYSAAADRELTAQMKLIDTINLEFRRRTAL